MRWKLGRSLGAAGALAVLLVSAEAQARKIEMSCSGVVHNRNSNGYGPFPEKRGPYSTTFIYDTEARTVAIRETSGSVNDMGELTAGNGEISLCVGLCGKKSERSGDSLIELDYDPLRISLSDGTLTWRRVILSTADDGKYFRQDATVTQACDATPLRQIAEAAGGGGDDRSPDTDRDDGRADDEDRARDRAEEDRRDEDDDRAAEDERADDNSSASADDEARLEQEAREQEERERQAREEEERARAEEKRKADRERRDREQAERQAEEERVEKERADAEKAKREEEQRKRDEERKRKEEEANRLIDFKEGIVLCEKGSGTSWRCFGPLQMTVVAVKTLDDPPTRGNIGMACGSDRSLRDLGMVNGMRAFGCGFGIHPSPNMASYPGNNDVPARYGVYISDRGTYRCKKSVSAYCRGQ